MPVFFPKGSIALQLLGEDDEARFLRRAQHWASKMEPPDGPIASKVGLS